MSTLVIPDHDPIILAKQISSLDHVSSGRVIVGVGAGWNLEEIANHGVDPRYRVSIMCERVAAMKAIWTNNEAEYHSRFVDFDPIWQWPKPIQKPHPPILFGGQGERVLQRVLDYGTGWLVSGRHFDEHGVAEWFDRLQRLAADQGHEPVPVSYQDGPASRDAIEKCLATGVERYILRVPAKDEATVAAALASHRALIDPFVS
jgi:probable F420-dependent oxidoreductase